MLNKHINHVRSELESKYSTKENKIEFTHTHSYTCNNRLYHIFDFTDAKGKEKSLILSSLCEFYTTLQVKAIFIE